jgi:hypothetical protein
LLPVMWQLIILVWLYKTTNIMAKALLKFAYRQVIDINSTGNFEKAVFENTYKEFLLKSQAYNLGHGFSTFSQMKRNDGRANSLHYKLSFAALHLLHSLDNRIPDIKDNAGRSLLFETPKFELIESDIEDKRAHQIAINYCTGVYTLMNIAGEYMILAEGDASDQEMCETFTLKMQPGLSVVFYKELLLAEPAYLNGHDTLLMYNIKGNLI